MNDRKWLFVLGTIVLVVLSSVGTFVAMSLPPGLVTSAEDGYDTFDANPETDVIHADELIDIELESFKATAYSNFGITFSGVLVQRGIVAADPAILPIGSVIEVVAGPYSGIYVVMDTGGVVKGRLIDIYMPDEDEAIQFGRQDVKLRVLRKGWHPDPVPTFEYSLAG